MTGMAIAIMMTTPTMMNKTVFQGCDFSSETFVVLSSTDYRQSCICKTGTFVRWSLIYSQQNNMYSRYFEHMFSELAANTYISENVIVSNATYRVCFVSTILY